MTGYVYAYRLCPPGPGCQPKDGLIRITQDPIMFGGREYWGTAVYDRPLTEQEESDYDLSFVGTLEE